MQRRFVYSVALASMMLGACELVEKEEEVLARPEARHMTGIGEITQISVMWAADRDMADRDMVGRDTTGRLAGAAPGGLAGREAEGLADAAPGETGQAHGCLDQQGRAALQRVLEGVWEGTEDGCDLVAVLLKEGWHDRKEDRRRDSALGYEPLVTTLLTDPMSAGAGLPSGFADPSASLPPGADGNIVFSEDVIIDILIPPGFEE